MDLLSPNTKKRSLTLGWFKNALKQLKDLSGNQIFAPAFEARLDQLVNNRNTFVHRFWIECFSGPRKDFPPSLEEVFSAGRFLSTLAADADYLIAVFQGLFYTIGNASAEAEGVQALEESTFWLRLSQYEEDFLAARPDSGSDPEPQ